VVCECDQIISKNIFETKTEDVLKVVRSRLILLEDVENDLREVKMKMKEKILRGNTSKGDCTYGNRVTEDFFQEIIGWIQLRY
jgi:hypothetical protein